jgi:ferric-dicitrate binding protein FerR (iron transport regulator)
VSVLEGVVEVMGRDSPAEDTYPAGQRAQRLVPALESGQAASVTNEGAIASVGGADLRRIQAWQDRKLDFDAEPLDPPAELPRR